LERDGIEHEHQVRHACLGVITQVIDAIGLAIFVVVVEERVDPAIVISTSGWARRLSAQVGSRSSPP